MTDILTALFLLPVPIMNISVSAPKIPAGYRALRPDELVRPYDYILREKGETQSVSFLLPCSSARAKDFCCTIIRILRLPEGYRWLTDKEETQAGDRYVEDNGDTAPVLLHGTCVSAHRVVRPVQTFPLPAAWRELHPEELVAHGDLAMSLDTGKTEEACLFGSRADWSKRLKYYRRLEPEKAELATELGKLKDQNAALAKKLEAAELQTSLAKAGEKTAENNERVLRARIRELETELAFMKTDNALLRRTVVFV